MAFDVGVPRTMDRYLNFTVRMKGKVTVDEPILSLQNNHLMLHVLHAPCSDLPATAGTAEYRLFRS